MRVGPNSPNTSFRWPAKDFNIYPTCCQIDSHGATIRQRRAGLRVALPLIDVNSAVQLAVDAYGWWKAKERSMSLIEIIQANGGRLISAMSFNVIRYISARQITELRGIA